MKTNARQQTATIDPASSAVVGPGQTPKHPSEGDPGPSASHSAPAAYAASQAAAHSPVHSVAHIAGFMGPVDDAPASADAAVAGAGTKRSRLRPALLVAAALAAGALAWMYARDPAAPAAPVAAAGQPLELAAVDVATVQPRALTRLLPLSGSIAPFVQAKVKSRVAGEIEQVTVREGQDVRQGDVIARIDTRNLQAQYDRGLAAVEKARADMELATLNRDKNRALLEQHYISRNTYEATESAYAASVATYKLAQAEARLAKINLDDAVIRAPFDGTIAARLVQPGETVAADTAIVSLVDLRQMVLEAAVPAAEIPSVRVGQTASFKVGGFGAREFDGQVQRINPVTTDGSRAITIYIAVPNADRALKGGMFAQGRLTLDATQPVLAVARRAVREEAGAQYVYTLQNGTIVRTPVRLGAPVEGNAYVEVREGLSDGERVILTEISEARAGSAAIVRDEARERAGGDASSVASGVASNLDSGR